uniref:Laminin, alpha 2 n=1 Tax=Salmo trutta TaxID=8032 RepID=A0A674B6M8_SALTR
QMCSSGHRRVNSSVFQGVCEPCDCHGHATQCDDITRQCLGCTDHTTGFHCDECIPGFYGEANKGTPKERQPCACPFNISSNNPTCHVGLRGELICDRWQPGYTGARCDKCINGYFGQPVVKGGLCQPCRGNGNLDLASRRSCDTITGSCLRCRDGYGGTNCDTCAEGFYGDAIEAKHCQRCQCHNTYDIQSRGGCVPSKCDTFRSKSFDCNKSAQYQCQTGVTGPKCDQCAPGHFNFQEGGCTPCQCAHVGNNSDGNAGKCICPPNTVWERCDKCVPNHWGHDIMAGCKACGCNQVGSLTQQCNPNTGCCLCREQCHGKKCSECRLGYRDFPQCISCNCNVAVSDIQTCDADQDVCACVDRTGQCSCKANIQGLKCDKCTLGTFGLSTRNPLGCSQCYCFGMTSNCTGPHPHLSLKPEQTKLPLVDNDNQQETTRGVTFQHPEIIANADLVTQKLTEPYYWRLPEQFQASMITAYGGKLKYAIYFEGRDETGRTSYKPQVIIKGVSNRDKVMVRHMQGLQIGQLTRHEINMTEVRTWKYEDKKAMTREDFMDVLFYVDYVLIKTSHGNMMRHSRISEISMEVVEEGRPSVEREWAHQIEKCDCPLGYSGLSCVSVGCAASRADIGSCVQCQCNGHSEACDPETSICQNCQHNTEGDRCERCAPEYYGVVRGRPGDCKPCAFTEAQLNEGLNDYHCAACPEGHVGKYCERCATGYHSDPRAPGGKCEQCKCDTYGAWPQPCDLRSGQCRCHPWATGRTCIQCMERHVCGPSGIMCTHTNITY